MSCLSWYIIVMLIPVSIVILSTSIMLMRIQIAMLMCYTLRMLTYELLRFDVMLIVHLIHGDVALIVMSFIC